MKKSNLFTAILLRFITLPACSKKAQKTLKEAVVEESSIESSNNEKENVSVSQSNPIPSSYIPTNVSVSQSKPSAPLTSFTCFS
jgi:hypothetical protein